MMELAYLIVGEKTRFLYDLLAYTESCLLVLIDVEKGIQLYCPKNIQLSKSLSLVQQWSRRIVSRVTVSKKIILPKLNLLFNSLTTPNKALLSSLNNVIFNFIW